MIDKDVWSLTGYEKLQELTEKQWWLTSLLVEKQI